MKENIKTLVNGLPHIDSILKLVAYVCVVLGIFLAIGIQLLPEDDRIFAYSSSLLFFLVSVFLWYRLESAKIKSERHYSLSDNEIAESNIKYFDFGNEQEKKDFFDGLVASIENSTQEIFRSGRGFSEIKTSDSEIVKRLLHAERTALSKQVKIRRIQTSAHALNEWTEQYSALMKEFPGLLRVYPDYDNPSLVNVGIIDPLGNQPIVQVLFESHVSTGDESHHESTAGLFIYNAQKLANALRNQFVNTIESRAKDQLTPVAMTRIASKNKYFAYGSNLSSSQIIERCPSATKVGPGILYGWKLEFSVFAKHHKALVAGIVETGDTDDCVWGVVYSLSDSDKEKLVNIEYGGYTEKTVNIKMLGKQSHTDVVTFIPVKRESSNAAASLPISSNYLNVMLEGARENDLMELATHIKKLKEIKKDLKESALAE